MAYRKPGVKVVQEFLAAAPALAAFTLPSVSIGRAFQVVNDVLVGSYAGEDVEFSYPNLAGGAIVDLEASDSLDPLAAIKRPVSATLKQVKAEIVSAEPGGVASGTSFTDSTSGVFAAVLAGDVVHIEEALALTIIAAQTNGQSVTATPNQLKAGTPGQFADVKVGDTVEVTGGTNTLTGTFLVEEKPDNSTLLLDGDINDGVGASTNVAYSITGDRGGDIAGDYKIKEKTDDNTLVLQSPIMTDESFITYSIRRSVSDKLLVRDDAAGFTATEDAITMQQNIAVTIDAIQYPVVDAKLYVSYRALRNDLASEVKEFSGVNSLIATFGQGQLVPANELGYALSIMLQNTTTPVYGLGLNESGLEDEVLAYTAAADVLSTTDMYALVPLTQNAVVHTLFNNHVTQMSDPEAKRERVVLVNSKLLTTAQMKEESTTVTTANGSRQIVTTKTSGAGNVAQANVLTDATAGVFANVRAGDKLVIVAGTGVLVGTSNITAKVDDNTIQSSASIITSGTPSGVSYYIYRPDGLAVGGSQLYDRNGGYLDAGVAPGHFLVIKSGAYAGRYKIATVPSNVELTVSPALPGVVTFQSAIEYEIERDLSKSQQAEAVAGYSSAFSNRRLVHIWPDIVQVAVGQTLRDVPGYFACAAIGALTTGLPTQQGFTNLAISGFLGLKHSSRYFSDAQLNTIADGGTMILAQDGEAQPLYIRHQLTTDRSSIKFQEYSVTKNIDYAAKFIRTTYGPFVGQYNIVDTTLDALKTTAEAILTFLRDSTRVPRFGGVIRSGRLVSIAESPDQIDTVIIRFQLSMPIPLNNIDIYVAV